jgi:outer membrane protein assembly factor BamB
LADLDGDGQIEAVTGQAGPNRAPCFQARNLAGGENLLWEKDLPSTDRTGLPQPRPLYLRSGSFLGREASDVYAWIGTPVVRSGVLRGDNGDWIWDKGQIPENERYWGPSVNFASVWDFDEDGAEDLVFTNPDYFCIASGTSGELLAGPDFPPEIFKQTSQGLYTFPAILGRGESVPLVALVGGHYFQGVMTLDRQPLWYDQPPVGENRSGFEAFLQDEAGRWLLGMGRQNGEFACLEAATGKTLWEIDTGATCSSPAVVDVEGDGLMEFVFGTSHGELLAVGVDSSDAPRKVWEKPLPSGAGDPIAADLDGDGRCDLAVPLANGEVWVLGNPQE